MADEDLTDCVDVAGLARLLASPQFDVEACRERIARYARQGDGEAGRGIGAIAEARKKHAGDRLVELKPALIAQLSFTRDGVFSTDVGYRTYGALGHAIWHHRESTRLLDASPFAIAELMRALHAHTDDIDRLARDLVSWIELGDGAARGRLRPVVERAGTLELREVGYTPGVGARMLEVLALGAATVEDKIERVYANIASQTSHAAQLRSFARLLEDLDGVCDAPAYESEVFSNSSDRAYARATFEVFWRLVRRYRAVFDRHPTVFAKNVGSDEALQLLGIIDETCKIRKAGTRGEPWRIMRAGRLVMSTAGDPTYLPRFTVSAAKTEAAARKSYEKKLAAKRTPKPRKR